ncbi:MAG TPA: thiamine pyrophosphate-binding protein [Capsulimonadaceae bacterium]|jgi:acetolactate synthase-1/2/3 large subunit
MRLADYVMQALVGAGVTDLFLVTGGAAMHLNDAVGRCDGLRYICCHHEQSCAMAAESYYRLTGRLAAVNVTAGPGATNAITGVFGAWTDSIGMIVLSGQVKTETLTPPQSALRQLGDQEVDIVRMVAPITKYAVTVTDAQSIRYHLERALHLAVSGRPGPVWLDIPINVQATEIEPETLSGYDPAEDITAYASDSATAAREIIARLAASEHPVLMVGTGVRTAGAADVFLALADAWGVPIVTAWNAHDLVPSGHPYYIGRPGTVGDRAGNFAVQNADFVLVLGCRLNIRQISYGWTNFAKGAFVALVDIDAAELNKPTVKPDLSVHADVKTIISELLRIPPPTTDRFAPWLRWCRERRQRYPVVLPEYRASTGAVNPYVFVDELFRRLGNDAVVVCGDGTACVTTFQAAEIKAGQRLYTNSGAASMGYDLPAAIGASIAGAENVVCLAGDGSIQMNIQELATIAGLNLPIKIFVLNNGGYHSIRQTQEAHFPGNIVGCGPDSQVFMPSFERLAYAYGLPYFSSDSHDTLAAAIRHTLHTVGPVLCEIMLDQRQGFAPKLASRRLPDGTMTSPSLEDMSPFLGRDEMAANVYGGKGIDGFL